MCLSQVYRQILNDYAPWESVNFIARAMLGFTNAYFDELFEKHAWYTNEKGKRKQRFAFTCKERLLKNRDQNELPDYVKDEDLLYARFEVMGIVRRGADHKAPVNQHLLPLFFYYQESAKAPGSDEVLQRQREESHHLAVQSYSANEPHEVDPEQQDLEEAKRSGVADRPIDLNRQKSEKAKRTGPKGSYGSDEAAKDPPPKIIIDPNWVSFSGSLAKLADLEARELSSNAFKQNSCTEYSLRHLASNKTMNVPVLENMSRFDETPRFKYRTTEDGKKEVMMHRIPVLKEEYVGHWTIDPATNRYERPGMRIKISTMALYCFRSTYALFEFLTAMEYEHTPIITAPIDIPIRGCEGVQHVHKSMPRMNKRLRKTTSVNLTTEVIRSLFMEHTSAVFSKMPADDRILDPELDKEKIREMFEQKKAENAHLDKSYLEEPGVVDKIKSMFETLTIEQQVQAEFERRKKEKEDKKTHLAHSNRYTGLMRATATELARDEEFYTRYHIFEEYEKWMDREYGKTVREKKNAHGRTVTLRDKIYYPGNMEVVMEGYLRDSPYYENTRECFEGQLVEYPNMVYEGYQKMERRMSKSGHTDPGSYLLQKLAYCEFKIKNYRDQLTLKRHPNGDKDVGSDEEDYLLGSGKRSVPKSKDDTEQQPAKKKTKSVTKKLGELAEKFGYLRQGEGDEILSADDTRESFKEDRSDQDQPIKSSKNKKRSVQDDEDLEDEGDRVFREEMQQYRAKRDEDEDEQPRKKKAATHKDTATLKPHGGILGFVKRGAKAKVSRQKEKHSFVTTE